MVNGEKKWITNGMFADYFTVAVRTGGKGMGGISLLLLEKGMPGIECKQMDCMGVWASGTAYITFEDVKATTPPPLPPATPSPPLPSSTFLFLFLPPSPPLPYLLILHHQDKLANEVCVESP